MTETSRFFEILGSPSPVVATAIHHGHDVRPALRGRMALGDADRLREEDPFTAELTAVAPTRVVVYRSRFELDLNRPRERTVYETPDDAWGLEVWATPPDDAQLARARADHDAFFGAMRKLLAACIAAHGRVLVLDLHSYNHRREGPEGPAADVAGNPDVNVGTRSMARERWAAPVVDPFVAALGAATVSGRPLDARENVKFGGGNLAAWVHRTFPEQACALALEHKKIFMDEWTGELDAACLSELRAALGDALQAIGGTSWASR